MPNLITRALALASVRLRASEPPPVRDPDDVAVYRHTEQATLHVDVFRPADWRSSDQRSAVMFFFGGGWSNGSPAQMHHQAAHLATRGMVAMCAQYRVASEHDTSPFDAVEDAKAALRWLWRTGQQFGVDPARIVAGGASSGAHLAACAALVKGFDEVGTAEPEFVPAALVLFNPVIDTSKAGYGHHKLKDRYREVSPLEHVHDQAPPTLIMVGASDRLTPASGGQEFASRMRKLGRRCEVEVYPGQRHAFFNPGISMPHYEATLRATEAFLDDLGYLDNGAT